MLKSPWYRLGGEGSLLPSLTNELANMRICPDVWQIILMSKTGSAGVPHEDKLRINPAFGGHVVLQIIVLTAPPALRVGLAHNVALSFPIYIYSISIYILTHRIFDKRSCGLFPFHRSAQS
jgi:hypothetical protein